MCQLWALHVVIKRQFFTFIIGLSETKSDLAIAHSGSNDCGLWTCLIDRRNVFASRMTVIQSAVSWQYIVCCIFDSKPRLSHFMMRIVKQSKVYVDLYSGTTQFCYFCQ